MIIQYRLISAKKTTFAFYSTQNMKNYTDIFFDLDKTLWDFNANAIDTFNDIYEIFLSKKSNIKSADEFYKFYEVHNTMLWDMYRKGQVAKEFLSVERFYRTMLDFGYDDIQLAQKISGEYIRISPLKTILMPYSMEALEYLNKKYKLHIITNGFNEVQFVKINKSGLESFFKNIITSQMVGIMKPNPAVFLFSMDKAGCSAQQSLMIGDDIEIDIIGAHNAGMDQVFYNPEKIQTDFKPTYEINSLIELCELL